MTQALRTTRGIVVTTLLLLIATLGLIVAAGLVGLAPQAAARGEHPFAHHPVPGIGGYCGSPWIRCPPKLWRW